MPSFPSRSVHNTRIERLWFDVTRSYGQKWKNFFIDLETHCGLNPQLPAHIWLLHHLFLCAIDQDAQDFVHTWNNHVMNFKGQRNASPREMYLFSLLEDGPRGLEGRIQSGEEDIEDLENYGIDWDVAQDARYQNHFLESDPHAEQNQVEDNPFHVGPAQLSHVPCDEPNCPLTADQILHLDEQLLVRADLSNRSMEIRRLVWTHAVEICNELFQVRI